MAFNHKTIKTYNVTYYDEIDGQDLQKDTEKIQTHNT